MAQGRASLWTRAWGRAKRASARARDRLRGVPLRLAHRKAGLPLPGPRLMHLVAGTEDVNWFLDSGANAARGLRDVLDRNGLALERFESVLDFGCGVGRVMRHWSGVRGPRLSGTDYNPDLIAWCKARLPFASFRVNPLEGWLDFPGGHFDFIYAFSVFTHLAEPRQFFWLGELARVLRPGGHLLFSVHGQAHEFQLTDEQRTRFRSGELVVRGDRREGTNDCATFHPEAYVRGAMLEGWELVDFVPEGALGNPRQDVYLARKPRVAVAA